MTVVAVASPASRCCWRSLERCARRPCASATVTCTNRIAAAASTTALARRLVRRSATREVGSPIAAKAAARSIRPTPRAALRRKEAVDAAGCFEVAIGPIFRASLRSAAHRPRVKRRLRRGGGKRLRPEPEFDERFDEHALRAADCSNGLQPALADPVVDGAPRYVQERGGLIDRDAASEPR